MLRGALLHLPKIGPVRAARLRQLGVQNWGDLGPWPPAGLRLGPAAWAAILAQVERCDEAFATGDIGFFARTLCGPDLWRVLAQYSERAAFVDIETDGLHHGARITVIACLWKDRVYTFVQNENLDEFLDLLPNVDLMVTFNGTSFDVPMILRWYHIPELPCAHVDLRWVCYHAGWRGGLKAVESQIGLRRPADLQGVDGAEAVELWTHWLRQGDRGDRDRLVRYCAADAMALRGVTAAVLRQCGCLAPALPAATVWADLDLVAPPPAPPCCRAADTALWPPAPPRAAPEVPPPAAQPLPPTPRSAPPPAAETDARRRLRDMLRRRFAHPG